MIKNKIYTLIYRSVFMTLSFMGLLESSGLFAGKNLVLIVCFFIQHYQIYFAF